MCAPGSGNNACPLLAHRYQCVSGRDLFTTQFSCAHKAEPHRVEYVEPVAAPPGKIGEVASEKRVLFDHGFCEGLLRLLISAEERLDGRGCIAADGEPFPFSPRLDTARQLLEIVAKNGLRIERLLDREHCWPVLLQNPGKVLLNLRPYVRKGI